MDKAIIGTASLRVIECGGISVAVGVNVSSAAIEMKINLRACVNTSCSTLDAHWRRIPPSCRKIIGVCVVPNYESLAEHQLISVEDIDVRPASDLSVKPSRNDVVGLFADRKIKL